MARSGVYLNDVKRARDQLVAQGRHPSIDAVRAALGDTGSKTTIHKYLRELDSEETAQAPSVSEAILTLAGQLAEQLKSEAQVAVDAVRAEMAALREAHDTAAAAREHQLAAMNEALAATARQLATSQEEGASLKEQLHTEQIARHTAEQHAVDLGGRLADAQQHQASLEDKHRHARDALEHYRTAAKEQRDQESRRHEQQVHLVQAELRQVQLTLSGKLEELARLNKEAAAMANELGANKQVLYLEKETGRKLARKVDQLQLVESRVAVLETQLAESRARAAEAIEAGKLAAALGNTLQQEKAALEMALAATQDTSALEERLARLDQAVFGRPAPQASESDG